MHPKTGLPPDQDIQAKSGDFIFNQGISGENERVSRKSGENERVSRKSGENERVSRKSEKIREL